MTGGGGISFSSLVPAVSSKMTFLPAIITLVILPAILLLVGLVSILTSSPCLEVPLSCLRCQLFGLFVLFPCGRNSVELRPLL